MIDLSLSEEQTELVEGAKAFLRAHFPASRHRASNIRADDQTQLAEWGWFTITLPEAAGGLNLGIAEETLLYQEAGRFLLSPSALATTLASSLAAPAQRRPLVEGHERAALLMPADAASAYCFDRDQATLLVMLDGDAVSLHPATAFRGAAIQGLDESVALERGSFDPRSRLAQESSHRAVLLVAAMLAGVAHASCDLAVDYAKTREQFGQPIGAFQAVKHHCANMALRAFSAEAQVLRAALSAAAEARDLEFQLAAAARNAIAAAQANGAMAIQVHGGMGFTAECEAHLYTKRAHVLGELIGGVARQESLLLACSEMEVEA